jgi:WD40 repeat protein
MRRCSWRTFLVAANLLIGVSAWAAQPEELPNEPLPPGAAARFGVTRPILRTGPAVALVPPEFTDFVAPTMTGGVRRYHLATGKPLHKDGIVGPGQVVVSADGKRAVVSRAGAITVADTSSGEIILAVVPLEGVVLADTPGASLSGDGKVLAYGARGAANKGIVVVWDVDQNEGLAKIETAQRAPVFPLLSPDGKIVLSHGAPPLPPSIIAKEPAKKPAPPKEDVDPLTARMAQVWDVASETELFRARVTGMGGSGVTSAFAPDGSFLAVSAGDGPIDLWNVKTGKRTHTLLGRKGQGGRVAIAPDGKTVASMAADYHIQRWTSDGKPLGISEPPTDILRVPITGLTFADNERVLGWTTAAQFAIAWEAPSSKRLSPAADHAAAIRSIVFPKAKDGNLPKDPLTSGVDGKIFRWNLPNAVLSEEIILRPARLPGDPPVRPVVGLVADGALALWVKNQVEVFDVFSGEDRFSIPAPSSPPAPVQFHVSPDGLKLVAISRQPEGQQEGSNIVIWDLLTQQRIAEFEGPGSDGPTAPGAIMSADGNRLAVIAPRRGPDGRQFMKLAGYDVKTGKPFGEVDDMTAKGTMTFGFIDEAKVVVTSTAGRIWSVDLAAGLVENDIDKVPSKGEPPLNGQLAISPDGKYFAVGCVGEPFTTYGVRLYDWRQRRHLHTFLGHLGPVSQIQFSPDGRILASGAQDTSVLLWDLTKIKLAK